MTTPPRRRDHPRAAGPLARPGMVPLLVMSTLGFAGFSLLLPVVPLWAVGGGADETGAGLVNAVLMASTVLAQLGVHPAIRRFGWAPVLAIGLLALGIPPLLLPLSDSLPAILAISAVRGIGFASLTVGASSAIPELVPASIRGRAIGLFGLSIALPQMLLVPLGPALTALVPMSAIFALGALPVLGLPCAVLLGRVLSSSRPEAGDGSSDAPEVPGGAAPRISRARALLLLALPTLSLLAITAPGGALLSFTPQFAPGVHVATLALLALTGTTMLSRWLLGHVADRVGAFPLIAPLLAVGGAGLALAAVAVGTQAVPLLIVGMALAGVAYGGIQNVTLVAAFALVPQRRDLASTVWNIGFDVGTGVGSMAMGMIAASSSFGAGLGWAAALALVVAVAGLVQTLRLRRAARAAAAA